MHRNSSTDRPTRMASARAMRLDLSGAEAPWPPRSMKKRAAAKLLRMARKASATRYGMGRIIP